LRVQDKLAAISAIRVLGLSLTTPFIGVALEEAYRVPLAQVSAYYVILAAMGAAGQVIGGLASDRAGRVRVMALSALTAFALLAAAAALASSSLALEALTSLQSFFSGSFASSSTALIGDYFSEHAELVKAYGRVRVGANLGWALGAVVGGSLYQLLGLRTLLAFTSLTQLSTVPLILAIREPTPRSSMRLEAPSGPMLLFLGPTFLTFIIAGLMGYPLVYYFSVTLGMGTALGGSLLALNGTLVVLLQDRVAALASRLRPSRALAAGMTIYAIGYAILPAVRGLPEALADIALITAGEMVALPVSSAVAARLSSPSSRGTHMGMYGLTGSVARTLSSSIFAALLYALPPSEVWGVEAIVATASALGYLAVLG